MSEEQPQETSTQGKYLFSSFPLYEHKTPEFREAKGYEYIRYGQDNTYPDYLVYLYNRSSIHGAIVNGKKRFILGHGWKIKNNATDMNMARFLRNPNSFDTLDEVTDKCILDRMIFGGYALRVVWFGGRITNVYHQPFQTIRVGAEGNMYYVSNEWTRDMSTKANFKSNGKIPTDAVSYEPFNPNRKEGTQILYVVDYRPQVNIYPLPEYVSCNASIETDVEISNFHLNNIKTGFAAGTMVTFFNGKPSEEDAKQHERDLKAKAGGTDNGGQIILNYAEVNETKPEILPLRSNELDKQYLQLEESVTQNIFIGHGVTSPMLFGLKTEGQLGGRNELDMAWNLFSLNYVEPKRRQFESEFNYVLTVGGYAAQIELQPLKGLGIEITESLLTANLTKEELRGLIAESLSITLKPLTEPTAPVTTEMDGQKMDFDNILINAFSKIGISSEGLEFVIDITEDEKKVLDYIKGKKEIDIKQASKDLKLDVEKIMRALIEKNVIAGKATKGMVEIEKIQLPPEPDQSESSGYEIVTMYQYAWVDPSQASDIDNSRSFCKRLLGLNKLYTREEIDALNNDMKDFNKDVWKYRGGWMTVPNTDGLLHTPFCRHTWKQVLVKKKRSFSKFNDTQLYDPNQKRAEDGRWVDENGSVGDIKEYDPKDKDIIPYEDDEIQKWDSKINLDKKDKKSLDDAQEKISSKLKEVLGDKAFVNISQSETPFGNSNYITVEDSRDFTKTHKIRISDHSVGNTNRVLGEIHVENEQDAKNAILNIEKYYHPNRFVERAIISKQTKRIEVPKNKNLKSVSGAEYNPDTDKIISKRVAKSGNEVYTVDRTTKWVQKVLIRKKKK